MELCSGKIGFTMHDEICYESGDCPLCFTIEAKDNLEKELRREIDELNAKIEGMEKGAGE